MMGGRKANSFATAGWLCLFLTFVCVNCEKLDCGISFSDHYYDISSLAEKDYWSYEEKTKYVGFSLNFLISICHPLRNVSKLCSEPNAGVCVEQIKPVKNPNSNKNTTSTEIVTPNGGIIAAESLKVTNGGWLEYVYTNGSECDFHGRPTNYTTHLNLLCPSLDSEESQGPVLMSFNRCDITFAWLTNAACPIKLESKVSSCVDTFKGTKEVLNLHGLHSLTYYNSSSNSNENKYQINVCGAIETGPCDGRNATVCDVTDPSNVKVISTTSDMEVEWQGQFFQLLYNNNTELERYSSEKNIKIQFLCDRHAHELNIHTIDENDTHINFAALTSSVCTPEKHECVLKDRKGQVFDLRPLYKKNENWEVLDDRRVHRVSILML